MYLECFLKIIKYFGKGKILKLSFFMIMSLIAGTLEFVGIALIYPLVILLVNPDAVSGYMQKLPFMLQNLSSTTLALCFGLISMGIFICKDLYMVFFVYVQNKFLGNWILRINYMLMDFFIKAPYNLIRKISSADKLYILNIVVPESINNFVTRILTLCANIIVLLSIICLVMYKFVLPGIITIIFAIICILFQNKLFRKATKNIANKMFPLTKELSTTTYSIINCVKEIKMLAVEQEFSTRYKRIFRNVTNLSVSKNVLNSIPKYSCIPECSRSFMGCWRTLWHVWLFHLDILPQASCTM